MPAEVEGEVLRRRGGRLRRDFSRSHAAQGIRRRVGTRHVCRVVFVMVQQHRLRIQHGLQGLGCVGQRGQHIAPVRVSL